MFRENNYYKSKVSELFGLNGSAWDNELNIFHFYNGPQPNPVHVYAEVLLSLTTSATFIINPLR